MQQDEVLNAYIKKREEYSIAIMRFNNIRNKPPKDGESFLLYKELQTVLGLSLIHISEPTRPY